MNCPRCGRRFNLGWRVTKQGGTRMATIAGRDNERGVTCKSCALARVAELDADDQRRRALLVTSDQAWDGG